MTNSLQTLRISLVFLALCAAACSAGDSLTKGLVVAEGYVRHRTLLEAEVLGRTAYFAPHARDWSLLVTEHRGRIDTRAVLYARERYAARWHYLEVGPVEGLDLAGRRALAWNVTHPRQDAYPLRTVHAVLPLTDRTLALEYRAPEGSDTGFDELRRRLARYRPGRARW